MPLGQVKSVGRLHKSSRARAESPGVALVVSDATFANLPEVPPLTAEEKAGIKEFLAERRRAKVSEIKDADLSGLAKLIERDLQSQGKRVPAAAKPYLEAMRTMESVTDNYGLDSGRSVVAYLLGNLRGYKGETARAIKAELNARLKDAKDDETLPGYFSS